MQHFFVHTKSYVRVQSDAEMYLGATRHIKMAYKFRMQVTKSTVWIIECHEDIRIDDEIIPFFILFITNALATDIFKLVTKYTRPVNVYYQV